jgi:hypothetical protein
VGINECATGQRGIGDCGDCADLAGGEAAGDWAGSGGGEGVELVAQMASWQQKNISKGLKPVLILPHLWHG